jgi:adenosylcobyric acid synthase
MQMLGRSVRDPFGIESAVARARGLGLLPLETVLNERKTLRRVQGHGVAAGFWACLRDGIEGYEIHVGESSGAAESLFAIEGRPHGAVCGSIAGTYVHGVFEQPAPREALVRALAERRGYIWQPGIARSDPFDRLADVLTAHLDLTHLAHLKAA